MADSKVSDLTSGAPLQSTDIFYIGRGSSPFKATIANIATYINFVDGTKGDITVSSSGATLTVGNNAITYAKMQDVSAASKLLGRGDSGSGDPQEITIGSGLSMTGTTLSASGVGISDGDKGDITVSVSGSVWTIDNDVVTYAKIQNVSATDKLLGRATSGAGDIEEITCTAAGRALLDDADATAQRATLGLVIGTNVQAYDAELAALAGLTSAADKLPYFTGSGTAGVTDLTAAARTLLDDTSVANMRATLLPSFATNAGKVLAVNAGETDVEWVVDQTGGGGVSDGDKGDIVVSSSGTVWNFDTSVVTAFAKTFLDDVDAAAVRSTLGLTIGTNVQAYDAELAAIAGLTSAADQLPYFTGAGTAALTTLTSTARSLLDDTSTSAMRTTLGLAIGTDVQAYDAELAAIAGLTSAADKLPYFTGAGAAALTDLTSVARALLDDTTVTAQRATLLPSYTSNATKVLAVNSGATDVEWVTAGSVSGTKTSALSASPYLVGSELIPVIDAGLANEKATISQIHAGALIYLNADYTLTSTTSAQKLFNTTTNGTLTIGETGLYQFDAMIYLTTMSATSGNGAFGVLGAGTATLAGQLIGAVGLDATTPSTAAALGGAFVQASEFTTNTVTAATGTALGVNITGIFKVTATGTIIPSIALTTAAAAVVKAGSWFRVKKMAAASVYSVGNWS